MEENEEIIRVGKYTPKFNEILEIDIKDFDIYRSKGLPAYIFSVPL